MKKIKIAILDENLYYEKLNNGLEVYLYNDSNLINNYVTFITKYGGLHNDFKDESGNVYNMPPGIAHFLEHKLFASKDGVEPFDFYSRTGTSCNAYTSYKNTSYLFSGPENLEENLKFLLDFVGSPYFTDENVAKEQGIIEQEIKMYADEPSWISYFGLMNNLFINHPAKKDIAGTVADIRKIDKEKLYKCYEMFYHPANMYLILAGKFDQNEIIKIIRDNQNQKQFNDYSKTVLLDYQESEEVAIKEQTLEMDVEIPKISYGIKIKIKKEEAKQIKFHNMIEIFLNMFFGTGSDFHQQLVDENLIVGNLDKNYEIFDNYLIFFLMAETINPTLLKEKISNYIENLSYDETQFERYKKVLYAGVIKDFENNTSINSQINQQVLNFDKFNGNFLELIKTLEYQEFYQRMKLLNMKNQSFLAIRKKEK